MKQLIKEIAPLRTKFVSIKAQNGKRLLELSDKVNSFDEFIETYERCWIGGWGQNDYCRYRNPANEAQAIEVSINDLYKLIEKKFEVEVDELNREIKSLLVPYQDYQTHIITELAIIKDSLGFQSEKEILEKIEKFSWGLSINDYAAYVRPKSIMVYNPSIINKGIPTPPHIGVKSYLMSLSSGAESVKQFEDLVMRLLRQIEIKLTSGGETDTDSYSRNFLQDIFDNFHTFYNQIRNRHDSRESIIIQDEYDVQDVLHALLKLHFKDVRPEEYTPSYGGSSTRMDFLLKRENIVIEVKKTRERLADKQIGEQLILDVSHYRNHPNCKSLICFVYDPENRISNPRGLEADLHTPSGEDMSVDLYIRP